MTSLPTKYFSDLKFFEQRVGQPLELEDGRLRGLWSATLYVIGYAVIVAIVWAAVTEVREIAPAKGELIPSGKVQAIQHFEGGIVEEILVKPGDEVRMGTVLMRLKTRQVSSDINQLQSRLTWLLLEEIRLAAEQTRQKPDFSSYEREYSDFVAHQARTYTANIEDRDKTFAALDAKVQSLESEVHALVEESERSREELTTHDELFRMQKDLVAKGGTSKRTYLEFKFAFQRAETARANVEVRLAESRKDLEDAKAERERTKTKTEKDIADQRAKLVEQRLELTHQLDKLADRFERLLVRAPMDGVVKEIVPKGPGFVVQSGQLIAEIVPKGQELVAEVRIRPRDIGHIKMGDPAEMEVTTYDSTIHGKITGNVSHISAASFKDEMGQPYFRAEIKIAEGPQNKGIVGLHFVPGMLVDANILTGSKSIMRYILRPIYKSLDSAFSER
jgi:membrane fusion protein, adhesin transport system